MLRLDLDRQPRWRTLACGVELLVQPVTSLVTAVALNGASVRALSEEAAHDERFAALVTEIALQVITDWRGVVGVDDAPLPVSASGIAALMALTPVHRDFADQVVTQHLLLVDEKKGLAPLRTGSLPVTAPDTVPDAGKPAPSAPLN